MPIQVSSHAKPVGKDLKPTPVMVKADPPPESFHNNYLPSLMSQMTMEDDHDNHESFEIPSMLDMEDDENVEKLRKTWEIEDHWILRRDFLLTHRKKFPPERLLCLAQLFVNIETLGTQYDEKLMEEVKELAYEVPSLRTFRERQQELMKGERFKPPPKVKKTEYGGRQVTNQGYQQHQDNYRNRNQRDNYQRFDQFNNDLNNGSGQRSGYGRSYGNRNPGYSLMVPGYQQPYQQSHARGGYGMQQYSSYGHQQRHPYGSGGYGQQYQPRGSGPQRGGRGQYSHPYQPYGHQQGRR